MYCKIPVLFVPGLFGQNLVGLSDLIDILSNVMESLHAVGQNGEGPSGSTFTEKLDWRVVGHGIYIQYGPLGDGNG